MRDVCDRYGDELAVCNVQPQQQPEQQQQQHESGFMSPGQPGGVVVGVVVVVVVVVGVGDHVTSLMLPKQQFIGAIALQRKNPPPLP